MARSYEDVRRDWVDKDRNTLDLFPQAPEELTLALNCCARMIRMESSRGEKLIQTIDEESCLCVFGSAGAL